MTGGAVEVDLARSLADTRLVYDELARLQARAIMLEQITSRSRPLPKCRAARRQRRGTMLTGKKKRARSYTLRSSPPSP